MATGGSLTGSYKVRKLQTVLVSDKRRKNPDAAFTP